MNSMKTVCATLLAVALVGTACDLNRRVDHERTTDNLEKTSKGLAEGTKESTTFVDDSTVFEAMFAPYVAPAKCGNSHSGGSSSDCSDLTDREIDRQISDKRERLVDNLETYVFDDDHIVSETKTSVTYEIPGEEYCPEPVEPDCKTTDSDGSGGSTTCDDSSSGESSYRTRCIRRFNDLDVRVRVTEVVDNRGRTGRTEYLKYQVLVGPDNYEPIAFWLSSDPDSITARVKLGEIREAVEYADTVYDTQAASTMPSTLEGSVEATYQRLAAEKVNFNISVTSAVRVAGSDFDVSVAPGEKPLFGWTADGSAEKLTTTVAIPTVDAEYPYTHYVYEESDDDSSRGESHSKTLQHRAHLSGLSARATYTSSDETVQFDNVGLGAATSWLEIAGKRVLSFDLNGKSGRSFSAKIEPKRQGDAYRFDVRPKFNLTTALKFKRIADKLDGLPKWTYDDLLDVTLSGSEPVSFLVDATSVEMLSGFLDLRSKATGIHHRVSTGKCLVEKETRPSGNQQSEPHPFSYVKAGACSSQ